MATLLLPNPASKMVRRSVSFEHKNPGKWHFMSDKSERITKCDELISTLYDVEFSVLSDIRGKDLCARCWKFGVAKD